MKTLKILWKKISENFVLKLASLLVAMILWLVVVSIDNPVMVMPFTSIPIHVENGDIMESQGKSFEIPENNQTISISVKAERSVLNQLSKDNFYAFVNMNNLDGNVVPVEVKATKYSDRISSITSRTKNIHVIIENLVKKQFTIKPVTSGEPAEGYTVGNVKAASNVVRVSGPESVINTIDHAEVVVDVEDMQSDIRANELISLVDKNGEKVSTSNLELSIDRTSVTVDIYETKEIPVTYGYIGTPADGYAVTGTPTSSIETIIVTGDDASLDKINELTVPDSAIDVTGATDSITVGIDLKKYLPSGISIVGEETEAVVVVPITSLINTVVSVPVTNVTIENVPEGMRAVITQPAVEIPVPIRGLAENLATVGAASITGKVDMSSVLPQDEDTPPTPNVYEVPVTFTYPKGIYAGPTQVKVSVLLQMNDIGGADVPEGQIGDTQGIHGETAEAVAEQQSENEE
ncbi:MAG: hypothetical protein K6F99_09130 [Lachnospiraceae bacterium]|nr:hypothetical protein [Lachnospiraceae bacterium]